MPKDDSIRLPVTEFVREVALTAAREAASIAITEHIGICEARKAVLPNGDRLGLPTRVDRLEQSSKKPWHQGFFGRVLQIVLAAAILAVAAWALGMYRVVPID
ncbi:MAG TPA: hypothetical protein VMY35_19585 [Phycisphaerae bacterium]|nr:hypothetical protein [Phycisphaerae bacterium]